MVSQFDKIRAKKFLSLFAIDVAKIADSFEDATVLKKDIDQSVTVLEQKLETEINRSNRAKESYFESAFYTPALDECSVFVSKYYNAKSANEAQSVFFDALISIEYYNEQIKI